MASPGNQNKPAEGGGQEVEMADFKKLREKLAEVIEVTDPAKHDDVMHKLDNFAEVKAEIPPTKFAAGVAGMTTIVNAIAAAKSNGGSGSTIVQLEGVTSIATTLCTALPSIIGLFAAAEVATAASGVLAPIAVVLGLVSALMALWPHPEGKSAEKQLEDHIVERINDKLGQFHALKVATEINVILDQVKADVQLRSATPDDASESKLDLQWMAAAPKLQEVITILYTNVMSQVNTRGEIGAKTAGDSPRPNGFHYIHLAHLVYVRLQIITFQLRLKKNLAVELRGYQFDTHLDRLREMVTTLVAPPDASNPALLQFHSDYAMADQTDILGITALAALCSEEGNDLAAKLTNRMIFTLESTYTGDAVPRGNQKYPLAFQRGHSAFVGVAGDTLSLAPVDDIKVMKAATFIAFSAYGKLLADPSSWNETEEVYILCADNHAYLNMGSNGPAYFGGSVGKFRLKVTPGSWKINHPVSPVEMKGQVSFVACKGGHYVDGDNGCHTENCRQKDKCVAECTGCPDMRTNSLAVGGLVFQEGYEREEEVAQLAPEPGKQPTTWVHEPNNVCFSEAFNHEREGYCHEWTLYCKTQDPILWRTGVQNREHASQMLGEGAAWVFEQLPKLFSRGMQALEHAKKAQEETAAATSAAAAEAAQAKK